MIAEGMEKLMNLSPAEHRAMSQAARLKAETEFSLLHEVTMLQTWMRDKLES